MSHGGNSHQRRKARRLESRRRVSWRETAIRLWGCVPRSATEVAILNGAQWGKSACFDRCRLPSSNNHSKSPIFALADELRHGRSVEMWTTTSDGSGVEVMGRMDVMGRPDMVVMDEGVVEMVDAKLSQGQEAHDE